MDKFYHPGTYQILRRIGQTIAVATLVVGCASTPAPTQQMSSARSAVNTANSAGANEFAPLQLKSAMENMDGAERAMTEKNYARAQQLAELAQVDAQLAGAMTHSAKAQKAANALQEDRRVLREEIDRKSE